MKADLREIYDAPTCAAAETAINVFVEKYGAKYEKAVVCLTKDRDSFCSPSSTSLPSTGTIYERSNPIESVFATVRHRTLRTKGSLSAKTAKFMLFKLVQRRRENLAAIERREPVAKGRSRRQIQKRN